MKRMNTGIVISISLSLLSVILGFIILILLYTNNTFRDNSTTTAPSAHDDNNNEIIDTSGKHQVVERKFWGGRAPLQYTTIKSPVPIVIIKHSGGGTCSSFETCAGKVQSLQNSHVAEGLPDIRYSFLIGGDGNIYVGRGWDVQTDQIPDAIDIVFLGSYSFDVLTDSMIEAAQLLLKDGVYRNKLTEDYKLVAHNQTMMTESPGQNVYREIIKWPHYDGHVMLGSTSIPTINETLKIVSRFQWLAQPPTHELDLLKTPVPIVIIHHTATEECISVAQCTFQVRHIQQFHMESNQWSDIAYNFLIGGDGAVYEGRGWKYEGAYTLGYNYKNIGVAFIGSFDSKIPPKNQIEALKKLISRGLELGYIQSDYKILGVRQLYGSESPGAAFLKEMETWPHWSRQP